MGLFNKKNKEENKGVFSNLTPISLPESSLATQVVKVEEKPTVEVHAEPVVIPSIPVVKKTQFELSDSDVNFLGSNQYSAEAWDLVGRRHGIDPTTREPIANTQNRAFLAVAKKWPPLAPAPAETVTTKNIDANYKQVLPVPANPTAIRAEMSRRSLTTPTSSETTTEEI